MFRQSLVGVVLSWCTVAVMACGGSTETRVGDPAQAEPSDTSPDENSTTDGGGSLGESSGDASTPGAPAPTSTSATIRVHYPVGLRKLLLKGNQVPLTQEGTAPKDASNDTWELDLGKIDAAASFIPVLDGKEARGPAYSISPGQTLDIYPHFDATKGTIKLLPGFKSAIRNNERDLRIYLPPSYDENTVARYPVVYMHDGQVIFEKDLGSTDGLAKSFFGSWRAEKIADEGVESGALPELIIVGVDIIPKYDVNPLTFLQNITEVREQELTPTPDEKLRKGSGKGPEYLRMIVEEIKPKIDKEYRTIVDREHTFMAGSSLGGLISVWAGMDYGDVFGGIVAMSTSAQWDNEVATKRMLAEKGGPKRIAKVYADVGDNESGQATADGDKMDKEFVEQNQRLWQAYRDVGYVDGQTLTTVLSPGGEHKGQFWTQRYPSALQFIVGKGR